MAMINLLPWREARRQQLKKRFFFAAGVTLALAVLTGLIWDMRINGTIDHQRARNQYLNDYIALIDVEVQEIRELEKRRNQVIDRMRVIQSLQSERQFIVRLLDQLVRTTPEGTFLISAKAKTNSVLVEDVEDFVTDVAIEGVAETNSHVSNFMRRLDASPWLAKPYLDEVEATPQYGDLATTFKLAVKLQEPQENEE